MRKIARGNFLLLYMLSRSQMKKQNYEPKWQPLKGEGLEKLWKKIGLKKGINPPENTRKRLDELRTPAQA